LAAWEDVEVDLFSSCLFSFLFSFFLPWLAGWTLCLTRPHTLHILRAPTTRRCQKETVRTAECNIVKIRYPEQTPSFVLFGSNFRSFFFCTFCGPVPVPHNSITSVVVLRMSYTPFSCVLFLHASTPYLCVLPPPVSHADR
jgi:hypothetical protein